MQRRIHFGLISLVLIAVSLEAKAIDLKDKSTQIGDPFAPSNKFVVCVAQKAVSQAYGDTRDITFYIFGNFVPGTMGPDLLPQSVFFEVGTQEKASTKIDDGSLRIILQSIDPEKGWQRKEVSGESFFFSTSVSSQANFKIADGNPVAFDISECK